MGFITTEKTCKEYPIERKQVLENAVIGSQALAQDLLPKSHGMIFLSLKVVVMVKVPAFQLQECSHSSTNIVRKMLAPLSSLLHVLKAIVYFFLRANWLC